MKKNNKGFSLIEIIITLAIMGVLTGMISLSFSYIQHANTRSAAKTVDSTISKLKFDVMSKQDKPYLYLYQIDGNCYMKVTTNSKGDDLDKATGKLLCNSAVSVLVKRYQCDSTGSEISGTEEEKSLLALGSKIRISFTKSSGAFITDDISGTKYGYKQIAFGDSVGDFTINLVKDTGKHYIE